MEEKDDQKCDEFLQTLPQIYVAGRLLSQYKGFWFYPGFNLKGVVRFHQRFQPNDSDIFLASFPKSGATWLKSLAFSIVYRKKYSISESPLLFKNPHELIPFVDMNEEGQTIPLKPRILALHSPYQCLPTAVIEEGSSCRIIYIGRNLLDVLTSMLPFFSNSHSLPQSKYKEETFEAFCEGKTPHGPVWDHILGYWEASLKHPQKVLFLKYEDLAKDINSSVKKIAQFLGCPFSLQEKNEGLVEEITNFCSLANLKSLECNREGELTSSTIKVKKSLFFRKGKVGDWVNMLTPAMAKRLQSLMKQKFEVSGLFFDIHGYN